jgi:type IX secretion system PorP/SprF family membrane protein
MKNLIYLLIPWFLVPLYGTKTAGAQDPNFSQFFNTPIYFNPAFTGLNQGLRFRFTFRDQWPNLPVSFKSYFFSADVGERRLPGSGGLGLIVNSDNEGLGFIRNLSVGLNLSVRIPMSDYVISQVGIRASVVQKNVNWDDFVYTDQLNEKYGNIYATAFSKPDNNTRIFADFGIGGLLQIARDISRFHGTVGVAIDHLFQPDEGFLSTAKTPLPRKYVIHSDFTIITGDGSYSGYGSSMSDPLKLNPGIIYQLQDGLSILQAGLNLLKYNIYLGAWYKVATGSGGSSVAAIVAGYRYAFAEDMSIKFMYSYDLQIAGPAQGTGGAHEICLILEFDKLSLFGGNGGYYNSAGKKYAPIECSSF